MKTKDAYRCSNGHPNRQAFDEETFKFPCQTCGVSVYRYRDEVPHQDGGELQDANAAPGLVKYSPPRANLIFAIGLVVAFFGGMAFLTLYQPKKPPVVKLAAMPAAEKVSKDSSASAVKASEPPAPIKQADKKQEKDLTGIRNIEISNLTAVVEGKGKNATARVHLKLINHGDPNTPYPDLRLKWPGSTAKDIVIASTQYAHPNGPFTAIEIETELHKPPHAKGVDIHLNESN